MNRITYNSFNGKFFYEMQKEELLECIRVIKSRINDYTPSISGVCISDQEYQTELWNAWRNCMHNLNKFTD